MRKRIVTLTDTQIKALPTTPITLIPAPGSGFRNRLFGVSLKKIQTGGAYTGMNTTYSTLQVETGLGAWLTSAIANDNSSALDITELSTFLGSANDRLVDLLTPYATGFTATSDGVAEYSGMPLQGVGYTPAAFDNQVTRIAIDNNGSGNLGGGHSSNKWRVTVYYDIESLG